MLPVMMEAHEEHEQAVGRLFDDHGLPQPLTFWDRTFGPSAPRHNAATPFVAVEDGHVTGYAVARLGRLYVSGDLHDVVLLQDFLAVDGPSGVQAARLLLEELPGRGELALAIGWSAKGTGFLRENHWHFVGAMTSWRLTPPRGLFVRKGPAPPPPADELPKSFGRLTEQAMISAGIQCLARTDPWERALAARREGHPFELYAIGPAERPYGYAKLCSRPATESPGRELQLLDARVVPDGYEALAVFLGVLAAHEQVPVQADFLCPGLASHLAQRGWKQQPSRHGIFAALGRPESRDLLKELHSEAPFNLYPSDAELDVRP